MPRFSQLNQPVPLSKALSQPNGFVLLEVLLAMSLILTSWLALVGTYQNLALRSSQEEQRRVKLRRMLDEFEIGEYQRLNQNMKSPGRKIESARMSSRHSLVSTPAKSATKN